jgi:2-polyprenyl-6-methoxyphenol 4-hydroxylase
MPQTQEDRQAFAVVIVGGGMVGASLSLLLDPYIKKGLSVALVDANEISTQTISQLEMQQPSFDERTTAISLGSKRILAELGVWSYMANSATAINHIQVSQQKQFGRVRLHAKHANVEALGYVVENKSIGAGLQTCLLKQQQLSLFSAVNVSEYTAVKDGVHITLHSKQSSKQNFIQANLLVLADGANSEGCRQLGIAQSRFNYQQNAIVCNVSFDQPHEQWAYERFTQDGPLALLPMNTHQYALVWCMSVQQAQQRMAYDSAQFKAELQTLIGFDKGRITQVGDTNTYPLNLVQSDEQVRQHVVVLGNAAHALHPVAGQGFNLALRDARSLANTIAKQLHEPGKLSGLLEYQANQKSDQALTTRISHSLPTQFSEPGLHWSLLRGLAMTAMDIMPTVKQLFANQAMGLVGKASEWRP